jgi:glycosyltransferase involved in cell wall biosynthesis
LARILQVIHDFVPETLAGSEINTHKLSTDLLKKGHEVHVFCRGWNLETEAYAVRDEVLDGLHVRRIDFGRTGHRDRTVLHDEQVNRAYRTYLEQVKPDLVHIQHLIFLSLDIVDITKEYGIPMIFTLRNFWFRCPMGSLLYHDDTLCERTASVDCLSCEWPDRFGRKRNLIPWRVINPVLTGAYRAGLGPLMPKAFGFRPVLDSFNTWADEFRSVFNKVDRIHSPSQFLADMAVNFGASAEKVFMVENGIRYNSAFSIEKTPSEILRLGMIGVLRSKGTHIPVEAMNHLPNDRVELKVYGHGHERKYNQFLAQIADGLNIQFTGKFDQSQMPEIFRNMDALIVPSLWYENAPTVIREAFATGTPVISSNIGGMAEAVTDGIDGLHFDTGNAADLAAKVQLLLEDPSLLQRLKENIRPPLDTSEVSDRIELLYQPLLNQQEGVTT